MEQGGVGIDSPGDVVDGESVGIDGPGGSSGWSEGRCECGHRWPGGSGGWSEGRCECGHRRPGGERWMERGEVRAWA